MDHKNPQYIVVDFDIPIKLRVHDSIERESVPPGYEHYIVAIQGIPVMLRFQRKVRDLGGIQIASEDKRGLLSYSQTQVWFSSAFFEANSIEMDFRLYAHHITYASIAYLNKFISIYRELTDIFWARPVKFSEIPQFILTGLGENGEIDSFILGNSGSGRGLGAVIPTAADNILRERILSEYQPDELQDLAYTVWNLYYWEDYWSSALAVEMLFEAKVARILREEFTRQGLPEADIDNRFIDQRGQPRSVTNLLQTYIANLTGIVMSSTSPLVDPLYTAWFNSARALRNEIAHGKRLQVTEQQAFNAIKAVADLLASIETYFPNSQITRLDFDSH